MSRSWDIRIVGQGEEDPEQLLANPANPRIHPKAQQEVIEELLDSVGWVRRILVNRTTGHVIDGHCRAGLAISRGEKKVPVEYIEASLDEEKLLVASLDASTRMAIVDKEMAESLRDDVKDSILDGAVKTFLDEYGPGGKEGTGDGPTGEDDTGGTGGTYIKIKVGDEFSTNAEFFGELEKLLGEYGLKYSIVS